MEIIFGSYDGFIYTTRTQKPGKPTYGVGINDSPFTIEPTNNFLGKRMAHPAYVVWKDMLVRCYSERYKERFPTYIGVICSPEWLTFTNFAIWFKDNFKIGYHLDKDLLVKGNMEYGPNTCLFIPREINLFLSTRQGIKGIYPLGVSKCSTKKKYTSSIHRNGKKKHLGYFETIEEAHLAWQKEKLDIAKSFDFPYMKRIIDQLSYEIENNLETKTLC